MIIYGMGGGVIIDNIVSSGTEGQILKIHNTNITPDNNFRRVVDNDTDFNNESKQSINMSDIFNKWNRFTHENSANITSLGYDFNPAWSNYYNFKDGQNMTGDQSVDVRAKWSYNKESNYISSNFNASIVSGFYNTVKNKDWYIECLIEQQMMDYNQGANKYDDDPFGIMIGLITDSSNIQHTLILLRSNGSERQNNLLYSLVYDIGNSTYKIVQNFYQTVPRESSSTSSNNQVRLYIKKTGESLTIKTSRFGKSPAFNESYTVSWTFPSSKPSDWSQSMYNNIKTILSGAPIGFIVISNDCRFWITNSNVFSDQMIYRLDTDEIYVYNNGSYTLSSDKVSDNIPYYSWLYNKTTKKLFNYSGKQSYTLIDH